MARYTEEQIKNRMKDHVLVLDGAMGTMIQKMNLTDEDYGGPEYSGCNEYLLISNPDVIRKVHHDFLEAGADIIETDSFGTTPIVLSEYGLEDRAYELSKKAAELAIEVASQYDKPEWPRFVAGSMGPTTKAISLTGGATFDELVDSFYIQAKGLADGGADLFLVETAQDTLNLKAALVAILKLEDERGVHVPYMVSGTIEPMGTMLAGQDVEAMVTSLEHFRPLSFGINCGTGPDFMRDHIKNISRSTASFVSVYPNAGMPDEEGHYHETPENLAKEIGNFADNGWINIAGGCCGTTPEHIAAIRKELDSKKPRAPQGDNRSRVAGIEFLALEDDKRPYIVGERTNSLGSKKFRELIQEGKLNEAADIARKQAKAGADIIDVCLQNSDRDEASDMEEFLPLLLKKTKAPIMVDSTRTEVLEIALKLSQGKVVYNSVNLENGEERFAEIAPLYHKFGFALVVGTIDDDPDHGMGLTVERKLEIAENSYRLLVDKYGIDPRDIIFDPLVFPVGTGDSDYIGSAEQTIKGVQAIKEKFPECKTILGLSNVSFGLPGAGREILNAVFLHHNVEAGMDMAIMNAEKVIPIEEISEEERRLAEELIYHTPDTYDKALADFAAFYKGKKAKAGVQAGADRASMPVEDRLATAILDASLEGLIEDLDEARQKMTPLQVVNGPLMDGMARVGKLFNENQLIVAEVLQSAEVMKTAVAHLEQFMEAGDQSTRGKFLLATVKGDVHDIGKNLVEIILSNNGYEVIDLGIKVPSDDIIKGVREHNPIAIGLSGLLVKSAEQMTYTAADLRDAGINIPIVVGGAALSEKFARKKIRPNYGDGIVLYAKEAMQGLELMNSYTNPAKKDELLRHWSAEGDPIEEAAPARESKTPSAPVGETERVKYTYDYGKGGKPGHPADLKVHRLTDAPLDEIFEYINPGMLYKKHLGFKGNTKEALASKDPKFMELKDLVEELQTEALNNGVMSADGIYRFFRAASDENDLVILSDDGSKELERFHFKRQVKGKGIALSDFVAPLGSGIEDYVAMFIVSAGKGVREKADQWKAEGKYLRSHGLSALALESAEAFAEYLHKKIRAQWGIADDSSLAIKDVLSGKYQGARFSFGYPACPDLSDQEKLFGLLNPPDDFAVKLTDGHSMDPEASVSAIVFAHPEAHYFSVED